MRNYFGYIRVSTHKQGEGCSLAEQKRAITEYAQRHNLHVSDWYEEEESAAKSGRKLFRLMINRLHKGQGHGLILHKIDRGARNLKDWSELASLMDTGVDVHFAHESLDMSTRGGRLSADIQAVVAADYIRNLREEVKKGLNGRLNQGLFPWQAPIGYLDAGKGKAKTIDPVKGPLVQELFTLYGSGEYCMEALLTHLTQKGLTNNRHNRLTVSSISKILNNPFYYGVISCRQRFFPGVHEPLISQDLFEACTRVRTRRGARPLPRQTTGRLYLYQKLLACANCSYALYPEVQKGNVYYRCHQTKCKGTCVSEKQITSLIEKNLQKMIFRPDLVIALQAICLSEIDKRNGNVYSKRKSLEMVSGQIEAKLERLTDAFLEGILERDEYLNRKEKLLQEKANVSNEKSHAEESDVLKDEQIKHFFESLVGLGNFANFPGLERKRRLVKLLTSNFSVRQKSVAITWEKPYQTLLTMGVVSNGAPELGQSRIHEPNEDFSNLLTPDLAAKLVEDIVTCKKLKRSKWIDLETGEFVPDGKPLPHIEKQQSRLFC